MSDGLSKCGTKVIFVTFSHVDTGSTVENTNTQTGRRNAPSLVLSIPTSLRKRNSYTSDTSEAYTQLNPPPERNIYSNMQTSMMITPDHVLTVVIPPFGIMSHVLRLYATNMDYDVDKLAIVQFIAGFCQLYE